MSRTDIHPHKDARIFRFLPLLLLALAAGCGSVETVKGDVVRLDRRTLKADSESYRLAGKGPGLAALRRVALCPVQERRIFREVEVSKQSAAAAVPQGVGCGLTKFAELGNVLSGSPGNPASNCGSYSATNRHPTGRQITGNWRTAERKVCGPDKAAPAGGEVHITFLKNRASKSYPVGEGGTVRFSREDLARLRIYFTILRDMEIEARYGGQSWLQKLTIE
ncbi:MAG: hypothetical protein QF701_02205 [Nitrospinota bacterium]|jgi:hypothetical protein|nr:hypothetical protein [Nitrospinota bacterium]MDP7371419.1 hypothetical protein [Nitrospinota bacterium]MDP7503446.1 hypothetical protein [Nitrospinota bacterium]MDP7662967.1 hypothetical protein [Nitrospinota bacterium]HJP12991.1 hypothetical protein [Nitrospinota bacterium]